MKTYGSSKPIRILHLIPTFSPREGGAQIYIHTIADNLKSSVTTEVLTRKFYDTPVEEKLQNVYVHRYKNIMPERWKSYATGVGRVLKYQKYMVAFTDMFSSIYRTLRMAKNCDVIHLHFPIPLGLAAVLGSKIFNKPLVVTVHGNADIYEAGKPLYPLIKMVLVMADYITVSGAELSDVIKDELGVMDQITVTPPAVNLDSYCPSENKDILCGLTLITVGRLMPRKNLENLVQAFQASNRMKDNKLRIVGIGPDLNRLKGLVAEENKDRIIFEGFVSEKDKIRFLKDSHLFVQPSLSEGFSRATVEALSCGVPALVSDAKGVREPIVEGETGFLIKEPKSVDCIVRALEYACDDKSRLVTMGENARAHANQNFSELNMATSYLNLYREATGIHSV